ncbi:TRAP transporter substrate-binding protein [Sneathiella limimaris]|uniref:TRAP transporter substrate-binding protein n=1 Tax=Sneathiella limimaris TaxID=1964213 RepID=UPI00146A916D|nr:TRAP transporter substrate-binding protein [Sneathiella limimaris]
MGNHANGKRQLIKRLVLGSALAGFVQVSALGGLLSQASAAESWDLANAYGATSIHAEGDMVFAKALEEFSKGQIKVTVHPGGALGYKSSDHFDAVGDGAVEIADTPAGFMGGIDAFTLLSSIPFLVKTVEEARILKDIAFEEYEKFFEQNGQKLLYASPWPASGIWSKEPVREVANLKDLKIRTYDPGGTNTFKEIGAAPIQLAWADVVPQLATGGISSVLTSAEGGVSQKFVEHTPYFTEINYALPLNFVHMNKDVFDKLTPELQDAVEKAAEAASTRNWQEVVSRTKLNYDKVEKDGGTLILTGTDGLLNGLSDAGRTALNDWLKKTGPRGEAIINEYRKRTGK